jgi:hypothetical protein
VACFAACGVKFILYSSSFFCRNFVSLQIGISLFLLYRISITFCTITAISAPGHACLYLHEDVWNSSHHKLLHKLSYNHVILNSCFSVYNNFILNNFPCSRACCKNPGTSTNVTLIKSIAESFEQLLFLTFISELLPNNSVDLLRTNRRH